MIICGGRFALDFRAGAVSDRWESPCEKGHGQAVYRLRKINLSVRNRARGRGPSDCVGALGLLFDLEAGIRCRGTAGARAQDGDGPLHIDRLDHDGADPATAEYSVSMGGRKDAVGTVLLGKPKGLSALTALLRGLEVPGAEIETACRALTKQLHHEIAHVNVTPVILRRLRL